ncbi:hypothetical protein K1719_029405 [Acacia pycnantha]|nr:hypothetical protein K1719_029405 [Acacia pycnantha]
MRRKPDFEVLQSAAAARNQFRLVGKNAAKIKTHMMKGQLATFLSQLEEFSRKHKRYSNFYVIHGLLTEGLNS